MFKHKQKRYGGTRLHTIILASIVLLLSLVTSVLTPIFGLSYTASAQVLGDDPNDRSFCYKYNGKGSSDEDFFNNNCKKYCTPNLNTDKYVCEIDKPTQATQGVYTPALVNEACKPPPGTPQNITVCTDEYKEELKVAFNDCIEENTIPASRTRDASVDKAAASKCIAEESGLEEAQALKVLNDKEDEANHAAANAYERITANRDSNEEEEETSCAVDGIGWILCPVFTFLGWLNQGMWAIFSSLLSVDPRLLQDPMTVSAWGQMRNLANVMFVIAFLFIVYSQITGVGLSNYGIKKLLPKLVIAAILVNISLFICQIAVDLSNILGQSLKGFFESVASEATRQGGLEVSEVDGPGNLLVGLSAIITVALALTGVVIFAVLGILFPLLLLMALTLLIIIVILIARQALIVLLVIISPVAFVAYLLPNTEQWFQKWRKAFVGVLIVFPIISLIFGASFLAASVFGNIDIAGAGLSDEASDVINEIIAVAIMIVPMILVPGILKRSLTAIDNIGGNLGAKASGIGGGATGKFKQRAKESRGGQLQQYMKQKSARNRALAQGGAYEGRNRFRRVQSKLNSKINSASGGFGQKMTAIGDSLADKETDEAIQQIGATLSREARMSDDPITTLQKEMSSALQSGDSAKASAAFAALRNQGESGVEAARKAIEAQINEEGDKESEQMRDLRSFVNSKHSDVKGKDSRIAAWAGDASADKSQKASHIKSANYSKLTEAEVAGQTPESMTSAMQPGGKIDPTQAKRVIDNNNIDLKQNKRALLTQAAGNTPSANAQPAPAGSPAGQQPSGQANPPRQQQAAGAYNTPLKPPTAAPSGPPRTNNRPPRNPTNRPPTNP